jgi:hypothetical protein
VVEGEAFETVWEGLKVKTQIKNTRELANLAKELWLANLIRSYGEYEKTYIRLFDYGSTKENIANKLLTRLNLQLHLKIFKMKNFNFSSYLVFKCTDIANLQFDFNSPHNIFKDKISVELTF